MSSEHGLGPPVGACLRWAGQRRVGSSCETRVGPSRSKTRSGSGTGRSVRRWAPLPPIVTCSSAVNAVE